MRNNPKRRPSHSAVKCQTIASQRTMGRGREPTTITTAPSAAEIKQIAMAIEPRRWSISERDIVVEVLALAAARSAATARTGIVRHGLARHAGRRPAASARSRAAAAPAAEHLHLVADDLGGIALVALFVLP